MKVVPETEPMPPMEDNIPEAEDYIEPDGKKFAILIYSNRTSFFIFYFFVDKEELSSYSKI